MEKKEYYVEGRVTELKRTLNAFRQIAERELGISVCKSIFPTAELVGCYDCAMSIEGVLAELEDAFRKAAEKEWEMGQNGTEG